MSDTDGKKPLGLHGSRPGNVKQSFSHGRTKNVVVETKRKRVVVPKPGGAAQGSAATGVVRGDPSKRPAGISEAELERRMRALALARARESEEAEKRAAEEAARAAERERRRAEIEAKEREDREREEALKAKAEEEERKKREAAEAARKASQPAPQQPAAQPAQPGEAPAGGPRPGSGPRKAGDRDRADKKSKPAGKGGGDNRRSGKLTLNQALSGEGGRQRSMAQMKRKQERARQKAMGGPVQREKVTRDVQLPEVITVGELANRMAERVADVVKALMQNGIMATQNQSIDADTAELIIEDFGHRVVRVSDADVEQVIEQVKDKPEDLQDRAPIITVMGHVDHGKTSLLDAIRKTKVVSGEAGGITQHIGAYQVDAANGTRLTFLDTPGHAAFTEMRARGANVTDIVVLVVAADDGVMPQTIEAINHTKAAGVPMIVAINKVDKPEANPDNIRNRLLEHEVIVEKMSGDTQDVEISAKEKTGLDELLEAINLQAELLELKARPDREAEATVIEAQLDKGRGPVATVLVTRGTLERGNTFVVGTQSGRVRAIVDDQGKQIKKAGPSMPVEVLGLGGVPSAGDVLTVVENEQRAREVAEYRQEKATEKRTALAPTSFDTMFNNLAANVIEFPVLVKADVQGSVEAITSALHNLSNDEIKVRVLHAGVGAITESDVTLAAASNAPIIGFNVRPNAKARELVKRDGVEMKYYDVIYHLTEEIAKEMAGELGPERIEHVVGRAAVKEVFRSGKKDKAAGLLVEEGVIRKGLHARLTRDDVIVSATTIASLRRFKDDVDEVRSGLECGVVLADTNDIRAGDQLEVFEVTEQERTL